LDEDAYELRIADFGKGQNGKRAMVSLPLSLLAFLPFTLTSGP